MGALSWLVPSGSVSLHHATKTVDLPKKRRKSAAANGDSRNGGGDGPGSGSDTDTDTDTISLAGLCENTMPKTCRLNPLLFNGHLQTCCTVIYKEDVPVYYKRWIFDAKPPENYAGTFAVDFVVPPQAKEEEKSKQMQEGDAPTEAGETAAPHAAGPSESSPLLPAGPGDAASKSPPRPLPERTSFYAPSEFASLGSQTDTTPMLVVLHGLSGGSHEIYVRHILRPLCYEHGWAACVVNSRGCAQSSITTPMFYNARATWDVRQTVRWLREKYPRRPLFGIGFSLGANILANYVGEEGDACLLKSAIYVSNPWNLDAGSLALQRTFIGREVYSRAMGCGLAAGR
ncbi:hypothetical protein KEM52_002687 [Ascosphaera acerosa]|nr:hypothetical protein KEM52_002687 [Ascosphaera acerosa]